MEDLIKQFGITEEEIELDSNNAKLCHAIADAMKIKYKADDRKEMWSEWARVLNEGAADLRMRPEKLARYLGGVHYMPVDLIFRMEKMFDIKLINVKSDA